MCSPCTPSSPPPPQTPPRAPPTPSEKPPPFLILHFSHGKPTRSRLRVIPTHQRPIHKPTSLSLSLSQRGGGAGAKGQRV
ncbi:unnamed protein product [Spirodela intermedia]|uniref:Uncharacterized protein n=1 Tax=Spirodela intermedia TaxID=51605 RepID=A0A7I8JIV0_SPIIN|nr:unnamed protein product [Spirodela intermedia]CAA6669342.1 unnamed protein product [Spirodela intermedia]